MITSQHNICQTKPHPPLSVCRISHFKRGLPPSSTRPIAASIKLGPRTLHGVTMAERRWSRPPANWSVQSGHWDRQALLAPCRSDDWPPGKRSDLAGGWPRSVVPPSSYLGQTFGWLSGAYHKVLESKWLLEKLSASCFSPSGIYANDG